jgi:hypothetical protein
MQKVKDVDNKEGVEHTYHSNPDQLLTRFHLEVNVHLGGALFGGSCHAHP